MRQRHFESVMATLERHIERLERENEGLLQALLDAKIGLRPEVHLVKESVQEQPKRIYEMEPGSIFNEGM